MSEPSVVSRRKAAQYVAGTIAAGGVATGAAVSARTLVATTATDSDDLVRMLEEVRRAPTAARRFAAFARCKQAIARRDFHLAATAPAGSAAATVSALYRSTDPSALLSRVIVRELDALPFDDPAWMPRFVNLEAVLR